MYKNPDGNSAATFRVLKDKNATHTKTASYSPLTQTDAWAYYNAIYLPSIMYPFHSGSLQRCQCQHIQKQVKQATLPRCSCNRNTPHAIVYGPSEYGGIEMRSHQTEQGLHKYTLSWCLSGLKEFLAKWHSSLLHGPSSWLAHRNQCFQMSRSLPLILLL